MLKTVSMIDMARLMPAFEIMVNILSGWASIVLATVSMPSISNVLKACSTDSNDFCGTGCAA